MSTLSSEKAKVTPKPRKTGALHGQIWMSEDFDEPDEDLERLFEPHDEATPEECID